MSLVSIIIPVYNAERHLAQAVSSALQQTWADKEIIIINDGSTDGSLQIARQFKRPDVLIIDKINKGASAARNTGLSVARGEWIQFLDADDFLHKDKISAQLKGLKSTSELAFCKTVHFIDNPANDISDNDQYPDDYLSSPIRFLIYLYGGFDYSLRMVQPNAFLAHRSLIDRAGPWNEKLSLDDDGEFFCRVVLAAERLVYLEEPLNYYRKHQVSGSLSGSKTETAYGSQFKSTCLKHGHMLAQNIEEELVPHIHTATFKALQLLMFKLYTEHRNLYYEVMSFSKLLTKHPSRGDEVYGGQIANFIGNRISWKLLKYLQKVRSI